MNYKIIIFFMLFGLFLNGCLEDNDLNAKGLHFQGRDCIACHNNDLQEEKHLFIAGTLFKANETPNGEDLNTLCSENLLIRFLDTQNREVIYSSTLSTSKGNKGAGNFFILEREQIQNIQGSYVMQITKNDANKTVLADSLNEIHHFNNNITAGIDLNNRYSCNACHIKGGVAITPLLSKTNPCN